MPRRYVQETVPRNVRLRLIGPGAHRWHWYVMRPFPAPAGMRDHCSSVHRCDSGAGACTAQATSPRRDQYSTAGAFVAGVSASTVDGTDAHAVFTALIS